MELRSLRGLIGAQGQRWRPLWSQAVGPVLGAATSVMGVGRDGTLHVLAADPGTRDELMAREADIVVAWNLAAAHQGAPSVSRILVGVRSGVGESAPAQTETLGSPPELRYVEASREMVVSVEDPDLQETLTDARARWLRRNERQEAEGSDERETGR